MKEAYPEIYATIMRARTIGEKKNLARALQEAAQRLTREVEALENNNRKPKEKKIRFRHKEGAGKKGAEFIRLSLENGRFRLYSGRKVAEKLASPKRINLESIGNHVEFTAIHNDSAGLTLIYGTGMPKVWIEKEASYMIDGMQLGKYTVEYIRTNRFTFGKFIEE